MGKGSHDRQGHTKKEEEHAARRYAEHKARKQKSNKMSFDEQSKINNYR